MILCPVCHLPAWAATALTQQSGDDRLTATLYRHDGYACQTGWRGSRAMAIRDDTLAALGARLDAIDERLIAIGLGVGNVPIAHVPLRSAAVDALLIEYEELVTERERQLHRLEVCAQRWQRCRDAACRVCKESE